jgi:hypothetical protein
LSSKGSSNSRQNAAVGVAGSWCASSAATAAVLPLPGGCPAALDVLTAVAALSHILSIFMS